ncbi:hypothetical protein [uncultured Erythrobacter sp.]|uniref:ArnT family glycosyltransferase n=1 Tax=uncultured Erythrobacter sp. TaxID=263913 RepID=UPI00262E18E5|nr:hypothetical protein [uncultured Erythrobacter sp.]
MSRMDAIEVPLTNTTAKDHSRLAIIALAVIAVLQVLFALDRTINWDEFYFYGQIADFTQGEALKPLQTLHVQLFAWLPGSATTGVDGIVIGRLVMLACAFATAGCVALIAGKFARREYALTAALVWLAAGFTMQHGWSFRTDPLAAIGVAASLAVLARARLSPLWIVLGGALIGVAGMFSLKAILFAPAFAGLAWLRWSEARFSTGYAMRIAAIPLAGIATFAALYLWHGSALGNGDASTGTAYASSVGGDMLFAGWPIYLHFAIKAAILSIAALGAIIVTISTLGTRRRDEAIALVGLIAPLAALLIYRNTLPYFYPMMLAPVIAASVVGIAAIAERYGLRLFILYTAISGCVVWIVDGSSRQDEQREIQLAADAIFDEPVGYFDFPDMLPQHRKANGFLTSWGIESLYRGGPGYYRAILENETVPLVLTADPEQNANLLAIMEEGENQRFFHAEERDVLRATYRHFWGPFWLAGREVAAGHSERVEVLVPGPYTVTGGPILIDGNERPQGMVITLRRGFIELANPGEAPAGIIWGERLERPDMPVPERPYWRGF